MRVQRRQRVESQFDRITEVAFVVLSVCVKRLLGNESRCRRIHIGCIADEAFFAGRMVRYAPDS